MMARSFKFDMMKIRNLQIKFRTQYLMTENAYLMMKNNMIDIFQRVYFGEFKKFLMNTSLRETITFDLPFLEFSVQDGKVVIEFKIRLSNQQTRNTTR